METEELLKKALESAKKNGEVLMVIHHKDHELNYIKQGNEDVMAGCMALMLGDGLDGEDEAKRSFAIMYLVAGAAAEANGLPVVKMINEMKKEL